MDPVKLMIDALGREVGEVRKRYRGSANVIRNGERVGALAGYWLYRFRECGELEVGDESPVELVVGQRRARGVVVSLREGVLTLGLEEDLGVHIEEALLLTDPCFLLDRLRQRLQNLAQGGRPFNQQTAESVLGLRPIRFEVHQRGGAAGCRSLEEANAEQRQAIEVSQHSPVTFIWGPPGTGKTLTLAFIAEACYRSGRSILLVSNTNIAVDTALHRICERLKGDPGLETGLVLRYGPIASDELRQQYGKFVVLDEVVERLSKPLREERAALERTAQALASEEKSLQEALRQWDVLEEEREKLGSVQDRLNAVRSAVRALQTSVEQRRRRVEELSDLLQQARKMGRLERLFKRLNPVQLEAELRQEQEQLQRSEEAIQNKRVQQRKLEEQLATVRFRLKQLEEVTKRFPTRLEITHRLASIQTARRETYARLAAIDRDLPQIRKQLVQDCKILATTVHRTYLHEELERAFDVVIVDEASMLILPLVYYAAGLATQSVVVAGDFRQLPPIVVSGEQVVLDWLKRNVFETANIPQIVRSGQRAPYLVGLKRQYRMRREICEVVSDLFYPDHRLDTARRAAHRARARLPFGEQAIFYVDTAGVGARAVRAEGGSRYNLCHAMVVRSLVLGLAEAGWRVGMAESAEVGVITPFAKQARLIRVVLEAALSQSTAGMVATVHRFQGSEKPLIILDLTDSWGVRLSPFLSAKELTEDGAKLLNVALSRAREHIIVLANMDYLNRVAPNGAIVRRLVELLRANGEPLPTEELLSSPESPSRANSQLVPSQCEYLTDEAGLEAVHKDLNAARESIVMFVSRYSNPGLEYWSKPLTRACKRGVKILLAVQSAADNESFDSPPFRRLAKLGIELRSSTNTPGTLLMIDRCILWQGLVDSLVDPTGPVRLVRIQDAQVCSQLAMWHNVAAFLLEAASGSAEGDLRCPNCGGPLQRKVGPRGPRFECLQPGCRRKFFDVGNA